MATLRQLKLPIVLGLITGLVTWLTFALPAQYWWLSKVGAPWLAVAFFAGYKSHSNVPAALSGTVCLSVAVITYYTTGSHYLHSPVGFTWLIAAVPCGALFGLLGFFYGTPQRWKVLLSVILMSSAFLAESVLLAVRSHILHNSFYADSDFGVGVLLTAGLLLPFALLWQKSERVVAIGGTLAGSIMAVPVEVGIFYAMRAL